MPINFSKLWEKYPRGSAEEVKKKIKGNVNMEWIENTCAIRMSYAINRAGHNIPLHKDETVSGYMSDDDKQTVEKWHYFKLKSLENYVEKNKSFFGEKYDISSRDRIKETINGKKGILFFHMPGHKSFTGHAALWNGKEFAQESDNYIDDVRVKDATFFKME